MNELRTVNGVRPGQVLSSNLCMMFAWLSRVVTHCEVKKNRMLR